MNVYACVGSSCHLKGSYRVIQLFQQAIESRGLSGRVTLAAAFCLGHCAQGVTIKVNDQIVAGVSPENFEAVFSKYVLEAIVP